MDPMKLQKCYYPEKITRLVVDIRDTLIWQMNGSSKTVYYRIKDKIMCFNILNHKEIPIVMQHKPAAHNSQAR